MYLSNVCRAAVAVSTNAAAGAKLPPAALMFHALRKDSATEKSPSPSWLDYSPQFTFDRKSSVGSAIFEFDFDDAVSAVASMAVPPSPKTSILYRTMPGNGLEMKWREEMVADQMERAAEKYAENCALFQPLAESEVKTQKPVEAVHKASVPAVQWTPLEDVSAISDADAVFAATMAAPAAPSSAVLFRVMPDGSALPFDDDAVAARLERAAERWADDTFVRCSVSDTAAVAEAVEKTEAADEFRREFNEPEVSPTILHQERDDESTGPFVRRVMERLFSVNAAA